MDALGLVTWPPDPIRTERLVLRGSEARDRAAFLELLASPEVHTHLGGPRPLDALERELPAVPERWPGSFVVERDGAMIGQLLLRRSPAHHRPAAALDWIDDALPGEPVLLTTQTANTRSMRLAARLGFTEVERFEAWDTEQWLGMRPPVTPTR